MDCITETADKAGQGEKGRIIKRVSGHANLYLCLNNVMSNCRGKCINVNETKVEYSFWIAALYSKMLLIQQVLTSTESGQGTNSNIRKWHLMEKGWMNMNASCKFMQHWQTPSQVREGRENPCDLKVKIASAKHWAVHVGKIRLAGLILHPWANHVVNVSYITRNKLYGRCSNAVNSNVFLLIASRLNSYLIHWLIPCVYVSLIAK